MAPRSIWSGSLSFGLVNVPVQMLSATRDKQIRFSQLDSNDNTPIEVHRFCSEEDEEAARLVPLLADRPMREGKATAYVCVNYACQMPTTDPEELKKQLGIA